MVSVAYTTRISYLRDAGSGASAGASCVLCTGEGRAEAGGVFEEDGCAIAVGVCEGVGAAPACFGDVDVDVDDVDDVGVVGVDVGVALGAAGAGAGAFAVADDKEA
eukprot:2486369-Rhodomonas_salina.1